MGGILPQEDIPKLIEAGVAECFTTGTGLLQIVEAVKIALEATPPELAADIVEKGIFNEEEIKDILSI